MIFNVYIPHSSDKTFAIQLKSYLSSCVYIPHSSDKTSEGSKEGKRDANSLHPS